MRDRSRKAIHIAMHLHNELGRGAVAFADALAEEARLQSNVEALRLWNDVAHELAGLEQVDDAVDPRQPPSSVWGLMQRIEYYRHRAAEIERKAAAAPKASREDMLELAGEWRDLALLADLQARLNGAKAKLSA